MAVVAVGQVDGNFFRCPFCIITYPIKNLAGSGFQGERSNRFSHNLADERVKDSDALMIAGIFPRYLYIAFGQDIFTNFNQDTKTARHKMTSRTFTDKSKGKYNNV